MANTVKLKRSSVLNKVPLTSDLEYGELAINFNDGKLFYKDNSSTPVIKHFLGADLITLDLATDNGATTTNSITVGGLSIGSAYSLPTVDGSANYVLTTDGSGTVTWESASTVSSIDDLSDVDTTTTSPSSGQVLKWDGSNWTPANDIDTTLSLGSASINDLGDVNISSASDGQVLKYDSATSKWINSSDASGISLTDLSIGADGTASGSGSLAYSNSTGVFTYTPPDLSSYLTSETVTSLSYSTNTTVLSFTDENNNTTNIDLSGLLDEDARAIASGSLDGSTGIVTFTRDDNTTFTVDLSALLDDTNLVTSVNGAAGVVVLDTDDISEGSTNLYYTDARVDTHLNQTGSITSGYVLSWNGTDYAWVAQSGGGSSTVSGLTDVNLTSIADNDLLQYDSANSEWVNVSFDDIKELDWTTDGNYRYLTGFRENGSIQTVRTADFASYNGNNKLRLLIATFTPNLSASISPSYPSWDQPISSFSVSVDNPTDITNQYVNEVASISASTGSVSALSTFSAGNKSNTPAGGVDWNQTFSTDADSYIRSNATTGSSSGGSASGTVSFNYYDGSSTIPYGSTASWSVNWQSPSNSILMSDLTGNTFLQTYTSTSYSVSHGGMSSSGNVSHTVTPTGGTVSSSTGTGTFTFTTPIHKDNTGTSRTLALSTTFTRPSSVTGTGYTYTNNTSDTTLSASFTYPSFWIFTASVSSPPPRADIISGTGFESAVTTLGNQTKSFAGTITNNSGGPQAFWFAVRSSASQPTSFKTGASSSLLSDVTPTTGTVNLEPDTPPSGYNAETYNLYGITLQTDDTYVSIS